MARMDQLLINNRKAIVPTILILLALLSPSGLLAERSTPFHHIAVATGKVRASRAIRRRSG